MIFAPAHLPPGPLWRHLCRAGILLAAACGVVPSLRAQPATAVLDLWPNGAPGALSKPGYVEKESFWNGDRTWPMVSRVAKPSLEVFLPAKEKRSGAAVVICPGGGYTAINIAKEGRDIAHWLVQRGVVACVLKYRLPSPAIMQDRSLGPLSDGLEAMRQVRRHAAEWGVRADRVGVMGFSSGGHLAATISTLYSEKPYTPADAVSARPDFTILVYPLISMRPEMTPNSLRHDLLGNPADPARVRLLSAELHVDAHTPPAFIAHSRKDPVIKFTQSVAYADALRAAGVPVALHLYEQGEHGYALGALPEWPHTWPDDLEHWLAQRP